jgi:glycosyltransferase involved in cell wall biosynthesis|tara:strand:+ start:44 stop:877 length:834 start_codon:yes stop_codon:yes gene_type:complete
MFSIIIPTYNNLNYFKICINSIHKNSKYKHEIIAHINDGSDGTLQYVNINKIKHTYTQENVGLCSGINFASKVATTNFILYSHDDMYFCPDWDEFLLKEINSIGHENFYISGIMIQKKNGHINFDCGNTYDDFDENKLLKNYKNINFYDNQGSHFAPHVVTKNVWNAVNGFSEDFNPGIGSDPDFNMKLWNYGIRIFKAINNFKVYHFSSVTTRKKIGFVQNRGDKTFLKKWGITTEFFKKHYLKTDSKYIGPLEEPKKNITYYLDLLICKFRFLFV